MALLVNNGKPWTHEQLEELKVFAEKNMPPCLIAFKLRRSVHAIRKKASRENISFESTDQCAHHLVMKIKMMSRLYTGNMFGERYLANTNLSKKEVHDLDNRSRKCKINEIINIGYGRPYDTLEEANHDGFDNCPWCIGNSANEFHRNSVFSSKKNSGETRNNEITYQPV